jgi:hypothetical protein
MMPAANKLRSEDVEMMIFRAARPARVVFALCCASALLALPAVHAAEKKEPAAKTKPAPAAPKPLLLSRAELRECMAQKERIRVQHEETARLKEQLIKDKDEITRLGEALKEKLVTLDRTSADAVTAYNAEAAARDKLIDAYEAATPAFNNKADALGAERGAYAKACENKRYDEKDEQAILRGSK